MAEIKVSLRQTNQNVSARVAQSSQSVGVNVEHGIIERVFHDDTLKGNGRLDNVLGLSESILQKINTFVFEFDASQTTWVINHNLNKRPSVTVVDSSDSVIVCSVQYNDENTLTIELNAAFKGTAYLN